MHAFVVSSKHQLIRDFDFDACDASHSVSNGLTYILSLFASVRQSAVS